MMSIVRVAGSPTETVPEQHEPVPREVRRASEPPRPVRGHRQATTPSADPSRGSLVKVIVFLSVSALFCSLFGLAVFHAFLVQSQSDLDGLDDRIDAAHDETEQLRLEMAELSSPDRVMEVAESLNMVRPSDVVALDPVIPSPPSTASVAAEVP